MIKIGICDDNAILLKKYTDLVIEVSSENGVDIEVHTYQDGSEVVKVLSEDPTTLDILYMDILMENMNGIDAATQLRKLKTNLIIIFLTSSEEYKFDSFECKPMAYIMKDQMTKESFTKIFMKSIHMVEQKRENVLVLKDGEILSYEDISYFKVIDNIIQANRWDGAVFETENISALNTLLTQGFFNANNEFYVGLRYISRIEKKYVILADEDKSAIPLEKQKTRSLKLAFANFMIESMQDK